MDNKHFYISEAIVPTKFGWTEQVIGENSTGAIKALILEGEFQRAEEPNRNKRIYSESVLRRETQKLKQFIEERNGLPMSMDHPLPDDSQIGQILIQRMSMEDACALCLDLDMSGKVVYGKSRVLEGDHGKGDKLSALVRAGFKPGVSSRGMGGRPVYNTEGIIYVPEDYNMITYDVVSQPSTFNAILAQRINEEIMAFEAEKKHTKKLWDVMVSLKEKHQ